MGGTWSWSHAGSAGLRRALLVLSALTPVVVGAQGARRVRDLAIDPSKALWLREERSDSLLVNPNRVMVIDGLLIVTDPKAPAVIALDPETGRTVWRYDKEGRGPGEFKAPVLAAWHPNGILVVDDATARLFLFSRAGALIRESPVPGGLFVGGVCSYPDGSMLLSVPGPPQLALFSFRFGDTRGEPASFPFVSKGDNLAGSAMDLTSTPPESGVCLASRKTEEGLASLSERGAIATGSFVEHVRQRPYLPPSEIKDTSDIPIPFSLRNGVLGHEAFVWFGGVTCASRCVDFYDFPSLRYRRSLRLVGKSGIGLRDLTMTPGRLFILGSRDGYPVVGAFAIPDR